MKELIAALPMYDWPEVRASVDAQWERLRARFLQAGIVAPERLVRRNADMPAVPGGIRDRQGAVIAPDPATLPPDELDYATLWRHPGLLFAQSCWGPLETTGLAEHVQVVGQAGYSDVEGGQGELYSSAIVARQEKGDPAAPPSSGEAMLPLGLLRDARLAFNEPHSMSGLLALERDLAAAGESLSIFSHRIETGGHRLSLRAVAEGKADIAAIDCRSWQLARVHEPAASRLRVVGWTSRRNGLPFIRSNDLDQAIIERYPPPA